MKSAVILSKQQLKVTIARLIIKGYTLDHSDKSVD